MYLAVFSALYMYFKERITGSISYGKHVFLKDFKISINFQLLLLFSTQYLIFNQRSQYVNVSQAFWFVFTYLIFMYSFQQYKYGFLVLIFLFQNLFLIYIQCKQNYFYIKMYHVPHKFHFLSNLNPFLVPMLIT